MNNLLIADTPELVSGFRLLTLRQALKLEIAGLKLSRGRKASVTIRGILKQAGKGAPAKLPELSEAFASHLREIGVLAP